MWTLKSTEAKQCSLIYFDWPSLGAKVGHFSFSLAIAIYKDKDPP